MKLSTKISILPIILNITLFVIIGAIIAGLIRANANTIHRKQFEKLVGHELEQVRSGLSLIMASSLPVDAIFGLEAEDNVLAMELVEKVSGLGLDKVCITSLDGQVLFPEEKSQNADLSQILSANNEKIKTVQITFQENNILAYSPIYDVETPKGYLAFIVSPSERVVQIALRSIQELSKDSENVKISEGIETGIRKSELESRRFLKKMLLMVGTTMLAALLVMIAMLSLLSRSISSPLGLIINNLTTSSLMLQNTSEQVSSSNLELERGADTQAASIQATSTVLNEISSKTMHNMENANQADALMKNTSQVVTNADESMNNLTQSMTQITKASEDTSKIIKTIDEIAFQTNLLALNAAVEAARAGEAGAGFAVVADEVRNLAGRAATAAKDTTDLIEITMQKIKDGAAIVQNTSNAFSEVSTNVEKVGGLVENIAVNGKEQALGIDQINKAVRDVDQIIQSVSVIMEESRTSTDTLTDESNQMRLIVNNLIQMVSGTHQTSDDMPHPVPDEGSAPPARCRQLISSSNSG